MRFAVYQHKLIANDNTIIIRPLIVLRTDDGEIAQFTDFHQYIVPNGIHSITSSYVKNFNHITALLNYAFFTKYHIEKLTDLSTDIIKDFIRDYGMCKLPDDTDRTTRSKTTVLLCMSNIITFVENMNRKGVKCKCKTADLYVEKKTFSKYRRKYVVEKVPAFNVYYKDSDTTIFRDIPIKAFNIIMNQIASNHKNILMLAALGAYAGLRPSEACNVRREDSPLGPGIRFKMTGNIVEDIEIDLRKELNLRSDMLSVGGIKRHRMVKVPPMFNNYFYDAYTEYMRYAADKPYEAEYGALTNTKDGKAMTYEAYRKTFKKVIRECIPIMLASDDAKIRHYGMDLQQYDYGMHVFRHFFSVMLVLSGVDLPDLMAYRGDKSPESSLTYLNHKSELDRKYREVVNEAFDFNMWEAGEQYGKSE